MSLWQFGGARQAAFTLLLSDAVARSPFGYLNPLGVGLFDLSKENESQGWRPGEPLQYCLYLNALCVEASRLTDPTWIRFAELSLIHEQLFRDFPGDAKIFLDDGWAFVGPPPVLQAQSGHVALTNTSIGTFGAEVDWGTGYGLLTAGHVGGAVGNSVYTATSLGPAQQVGKVVFCQTAAGAGRRGAADIAVVELGGNKPGVWGGRQPYSVPPLGAIEILRNSGPIRASVKGLWSYLAYPGTNLVFADVYQTVSAVTQQGDSGAVARDPFTGQIAGHVVGATPQVGSYVQEIDYQLGVIAANGSFANIHL